MRAKARAYISRNWKVSTPAEIISLFWQITHQHKKYIDSVLDMGAGDGRFSNGGNYKKYVGVEIDQRIAPEFANTKSSLVYGCVFEHNQNNYSACVGNPPYLRHNEISNRWRDRISVRFENSVGVKLDQRSNLYTYFILLGLQKTRTDGIVSLIIPYEWAFIPSAKPLRDFILMNGWSVSVYRFKYLVFEGVLTTTSISIINKSGSDEKWKYFDIDK